VQRIAGVYLLGHSSTNVYYVGESSDIIGRFVTHRSKDTLYNTDATLRMVLLMDVSDNRLLKYHEYRFICAARKLGLAIVNKDIKSHRHPLAKQGKRWKHEDPTFAQEIQSLRVAVALLSTDDEVSLDVKNLKDSVDRISNMSPEELRGLHETLSTTQNGKRLAIQKHRRGTR